MTVSTNNLVTGRFKGPIEINLLFFEPTNILFPETSVALYAVRINLSNCLSF